VIIPYGDEISCLSATAAGCRYPKFTPGNRKSKTGISDLIMGSAERPQGPRIHAMLVLCLVTLKLIPMGARCPRPHAYQVKDTNLLSSRGV
jgi:hypothetical protein